MKSFAELGTIIPSKSPTAPLPWQACLAEAAKRMGYASVKAVPLTSPINDQLVKLAHEVRNESLK